MKKIIAVIFAAFITFGAFAESSWDKMISVGLTVPVYNHLGDYEGICGNYGLNYRGQHWFHAAGAGLDFQGRFIDNDSNLAILCGATFNALGSNAKYFIHGVDETIYGAEMSGYCGLGYRFVKTPKFQFIASPVFSTSIVALGGEIPVTFNGNPVDGEMSVISMSFNAGIDLFASYRLSEHLSAAFSLGADFSLLGLTNFLVEYTKEPYKKQNDDNDTYCGPFFGTNLITPKISIVYTF